MYSWGNNSKLFVYKQTIISYVVSGFTRLGKNKVSVQQSRSRILPGTRDCRVLMRRCHHCLTTHWHRGLHMWSKTTVNAGISMVFYQWEPQNLRLSSNPLRGMRERIFSSLKKIVVAGTFREVWSGCQLSYAVDNDEVTKPVTVRERRFWNGSTVRHSGA